MSVIVLRRNRVFPVDNSPAFRNNFIHHTILHVTGLPLKQMEHICSLMGRYDYKLLWACTECISFEETIEEWLKPIKGESMMNAVAAVNSALFEEWEYRLNSTTVTQNGDDSSTTTWFWTKEKDDKQKRS